LREEADDDEDTSLSSSSSFFDVPPKSDGGDDGSDNRGYSEVPPHMMETVECFPSASNINPSCGYQRIVPLTELSQARASGGDYGYFWW